MRDVHTESGHLQVIFHNDDETPEEFVIELPHSVFAKPPADAARYAETVDKYGEAVCGTYSRDLANMPVELPDNVSVLQIIRS